MISSSGILLQCQTSFSSVLLERGFPVSLLRIKAQIKATFRPSVCSEGETILTIKTELSADASAPCNSEPTCVDAELICHISRPPRRPATHQIRWEMRSDWLRASSNAWALAHPHPSSPSCGCVLPSQLDSDVMVWTCSHSFPTAGSETLAHPRWKTFPVSKTLLQDDSPRWVRPAV